MVPFFYPMQRNEVAVMLNALQPKTVFIDHYNEWRGPFSERVSEANSGQAQRFARDVTAIDNQITLFIPKFFDRHALA
jgi:hypothetical protein